MNKIKIITICFFSIFTSLFGISCNSEITPDTPDVSVVKKVSASSLVNDTCDLTKIRKVKIYNYCCTSGWANTPVKFTLYKHGTSYKANHGITDTFFENLPFQDFETDIYGNTIEWNSNSTGVYNGSPVILAFSGNYDVTKVERFVVSYNLEITSGEFVNGGGIQIAFVDKDGNESENIYLNGKED